MHVTRILLYEYFNPERFFKVIIIITYWYYQKTRNVNKWSDLRILKTEYFKEYYFPEEHRMLFRVLNCFMRIIKGMILVSGTKDSNAEQ